MVKFNSVQENCLRAVVQEFRALVKKGRVVFISLNHKISAAAQTIAPAKIPADPTN